MFDFDFTTFSSNRAPTKAGVYPVEIVSVEGRITKTGNGRIDIRTRVTEGEFEGAAIRDGINLPTSGPSANKLKSIWTTFFGSCGLNLSEVKATFSRPFGSKGDSKEDAVKAAEQVIGEVVVGLKGYISYAPAIEDGEYPQRRWVRPEAQVADAKSKKATKDKTSDALIDFVDF